VVKADAGGQGELAAIGDAAARGERRVAGDGSSTWGAARGRGRGSIRLCKESPRWRRVYSKGVCWFVRALFDVNRLAESAVRIQDQFREETAVFLGAGYGTVA